MQRGVEGRLTAGRQTLLHTISSFICSIIYLVFSVVPMVETVALHLEGGVLGLLLVIVESATDFQLPHLQIMRRSVCLMKAAYSAFITFSIFRNHHVQHSGICQ